MPPEIRIISEEQVRAVLEFDELIPAMRKALMDFSAGNALQPVRTVMSVSSHNGWFAVMPAVVGDVMGAKMVTFYPDNAHQGKHTHLATIQLYHSHTGEPIAMLDGRLITEMRTAAVSAVATDLLAAPDAKVLAILGSGVQARSHYNALRRVREFKDVRVWSRTSEHASTFAAEIGAHAVPAKEAVTNADVILTLTSSPTPILLGKWLKDSALVCAVGAVTPDRRELDDEAMLRSLVVVESRDAAQREPGDILIPKAAIWAELGELLSGGVVARGRQPIVFKSVGIAVEDIAAAKLVYQHLTS